MSLTTVHIDTLVVVRLLDARLASLTTGITPLMLGVSPVEAGRAAGVMRWREFVMEYPDRRHVGLDGDEAKFSGTLVLSPPVDADGGALLWCCQAINLVKLNIDREPLVDTNTNHKLRVVLESSAIVDNAQPGTDVSHHGLVSVALRFSGLVSRHAGDGVPDEPDVPNP